MGGAKGAPCRCLVIGRKGDAKGTAAPCVIGIKSDDLGIHSRGAQDPLGVHRRCDGACGGNDMIRHKMHLPSKAVYVGECFFDKIMR